MPDDVLLNPMTGRPMSPLREVFGGDRNKPSAILKQAKEDLPASTAAPKPQDMAMECPSCAAQGRPDVRLFARPDFGAYCMFEHRWKDLDQLYALNPKKLEYKGLTAKQEGWEKFTVNMPGSTLKDLQNKFGDKLEATLRGMLETMTNQQFMLVGEETIAKLQEFSGQPVPNAAALQGVVYAAISQNAQLKEDIKQYSQNPSGASGTMTATSIVVELGSWCERVVTKAKEQNWPPGELIRYCVETCFASQWV